MLLEKITVLKGNFGFHQNPTHKTYRSLKDELCTLVFQLTNADDFDSRCQFGFLNRLDVVEVADVLSVKASGMFYSLGNGKLPPDK